MELVKWLRRLPPLEWGKLAIRRAQTSLRGLQRRRRVFVAFRDPSW
jgi:hypothetical protein